MRFCQYNFQFRFIQQERIDVLALKPVANAKEKDIGILAVTGRDAIH
jgi:hypothetical protein